MGLGEERSLVVMEPVSTVFDHARGSLALVA